MAKIKFGIIGIGNMGSSHMKTIYSGKCPEIEITAVADIDPTRLDLAKSIYNEYKEKNADIKEPAYFDDAIKMMESGLIDSLIVAIPHYDHPKYVIEALKHGIHAISEKPAGVYTLQVREMMAEADKHPELKFGMMFNQRTNHVFRKMKEIIESGELGAIRRTSWIITNWYRPQSYYDSGAWRATWSGEGGGVLLNQCPHNLDLWQWICGMPVKIDAKLHFGKWHDIEVEDDVTVYAEYANGATGTFITTTGDAPGTNRFEITCDGGRLVCDDAKTLKLYKLEMPEPEFSKTFKGSFGTPKGQEIEVETDGLNPQHSGVLNAFAAAVLRNEPMIADGREGINGLSLSNAMHLSCWKKKEVTLPLTHEDEVAFYDELMAKVKTSRRKENVVSTVADTSATYNN
jgi:predicted dehydrogenase